MKKSMVFAALVLAALSMYGTYAIAAEHGGKEHGGMDHAKEHGGMDQAGEEGADEQGVTEPVMEEFVGVETVQAPSAEEIRAAQRDFIGAESAETGTFDVYDTEAGTTRKLELVSIHERVGKTGDYYYTCSDLKDADTGELLDLDLDVEQDEDGALSVVDVRIHKVDGKERYTYDENDNRIQP